MNNKAFTLIELIASITLILILFTVAVPVSTKLIQNSNKKQCDMVKESLLTAADLYVTDRMVNNTVNFSSISLKEMYDKNYIEEIYEIKYNNSKIYQGELQKDGESSKVININLTYNSDSPSAGIGYYTYELDTDICSR